MYYTMLRALLEETKVRPAPAAPPEEALKKITRFVNNIARPFYLGQLADDIGWSLERSERYAEYLVTTGILRRVSSEEISPGSNIHSIIAYCVEKVDPAAAFTA